MKPKLFLTSLALILATISMPSMAWKWEPVIVADEKLYRWPESINPNGVLYARYSAVADSRYFPPLAVGHKPIERLSLFNAMTKLNKLPSKIYYDVSFKTFDLRRDGKFGNQKMRSGLQRQKRLKNWKIFRLYGYKKRFHHGSCYIYGSRCRL